MITDIISHTMAHKEQLPNQIDGVPYHPRQSWDIGSISAALDKTPEATKDIAHGPGVRYTLGESDALTLELFPPHAERSRGIVRLSTEDSLQEFYRQPQPAIREEGLIFETANLMISLAPTGELMTYRLVPDDAPEEPQDERNDAEGGADPGTDDEERSDDAAAPQRVVQPGLPEGKEGRQRVTYGGRLGTDPRTKTTPKGKFIERARRLEAEGTLARGVYVDVVAYEHAKLRQGQDGKPREVKEYYATSVTPKVRNRARDEAQGARSEPIQQ